MSRVCTQFGKSWKVLSLDKPFSDIKNTPPPPQKKRKKKKKKEKVSPVEYGIKCEIFWGPVKLCLLI